MTTIIDLRRHHLMSVETIYIYIDRTGYIVYSKIAQMGLIDIAVVGYCICILSVHREGVWLVQRHTSETRVKGSESFLLNIRD